MNILVVNQSVIDMIASFFIFMSLVERTMTGMSHNSIYDQFVCRFWVTRKPLWTMLVTSTYGIVIMTLSRYIAVIYPIQYLSDSVQTSKNSFSGIRLVTSARRYCDSSCLFVCCLVGGLVLLLVRHNIQPSSTGCTDDFQPLYAKILY